MSAYKANRRRKNNASNKYVGLIFLGHPVSFSEHRSKVESLSTQLP